MRSVLITGGSRGIGAAIVRRFAENGDRGFFLYRSDVAAAEALASETGATAIKADVTDAEAVTAAVDSCLRESGSIDVLVNNAGISQIKLFDTVTDEEWRSVLDTNLTGAFNVTREVARGMLRRHSGRIINIGSMWGKTGASCEVAYSASKAGLRGFTMALAKELGPSGITVNCVEPGVIATEMNSLLGAQTLAELAEETPLGRVGMPEDVAGAVFFLASEEASFITGQMLGVDGGFAV